MTNRPTLRRAGFVAAWVFAASAATAVLRYVGPEVARSAFGPETGVALAGLWSAGHVFWLHAVATRWTGTESGTAQPGAGAAVRAAWHGAFRLATLFVGLGALLRFKVAAPLGVALGATAAYGSFVLSWLVWDGISSQDGNESGEWEKKQQ